MAKKSRTKKRGENATVPKFDSKQYELLLKGVLGWNYWRKKNRLSQICLQGANLNEADLRGADLTEAVLSDAELKGANLEGAKLMAANLSHANLSSANLSSANLNEAILLFADLSGSNLSRATISGANLIDANLTSADLTDSELIRTDLSAASLIYATLAGADLTYTKFYNTDLSGADFFSAICFGTFFADLDLSNCEGLEHTLHAGPSTVGIDTLFKSGGKIPEDFLRGAGLPDSFIEYAASLVGRTKDFYSCFISHSSKDDDFARRVYDDLQARGVRCWFAPEDMKIGDKIRESLYEAIRLHDKLLLVLSKNSVESTWVENEVEAAFERERKEGRIVLFPVRIDDAVMDSGKSWAVEIRRTRNIGDFRNLYKTALKRLLRDLKEEKIEEKGELKKTSSK